MYSNYIICDGKGNQLLLSLNIQTQGNLGTNVSTIYVKVDGEKFNEIVAKCFFVGENHTIIGGNTSRYNIPNKHLHNFYDVITFNDNI